MMSRIYVTVGLPGSGKSTWAENMKEVLDFTLHSSDNIRAEFGDINDQSNNELVFNMLYKRIKEDLKNGHNVLFDATNLSRKRRIHFIRHELRDIPCEKICVLFATPYEKCVENNLNRSRMVPDDVMRKMYESFETPWYSEGWDKIQIVWCDTDDWSYDIASDLLEWCNFNQNNPHHSMSLGNHMAYAAKYYCDNYDKNRLIETALIMHDCGKPYTKSFTDYKGNTTEQAHYRNHQNVGAYNSLFYAKNYLKLKLKGFSDKEILYISLLVNLHMRPLLAWNQSNKAKERDNRLFGDDIINAIEIINECDLAAH